MKAIDFIRPVSMPKADDASSSSLMHCQKRPYLEKIMFLVTRTRMTMTGKTSSRFVILGMPMKPRAPPRTSTTLSELSRKTRTKMPKPRVAMARKSSRSLSMGKPMR